MNVHVPAWFRPEMLSFGVNVIAFLFYAFYLRPWEPGKMLYWLGCILLTSGLLLMKG